MACTVERHGPDQAGQQGAPGRWGIVCTVERYAPSRGRAEAHDTPQLGEETGLAPLNSR